MKKIVSLLLVLSVMLGTLCLPALAQADGGLRLDRREAHTSDPAEMDQYRRWSAEACGGKPETAASHGAASEDGLYVVPDFVESIWQNGDVIELAFHMYSYEGKGSQKFYINVYSEDGTLLGYAEGYFPDETRFETVFFTWEGYPAQGGKFYLNCYSDYEREFENNCFPFYIVGPQAKGRHGWTETPFGWGYYLKDGTCAMSQWVKISGSSYYFNDYGLMVTGWQNIAGNDYYFYEDGVMAKDTWIGDSYVGKDGILTDQSPRSGVWKSDRYGWYYLHPDGFVTCNDFELIDGNWYYFDSDGYRLTGWQRIGEADFYFRDNGIMAVDTWVDGYYLNADGICIYGGWETDGRGWWYVRGDGKIPVNQWEEIDGSWFYFDGNGYMVTGWQKISGKWYYFDGNGNVVVGWQNIDGSDYYFYEDGTMAHDTMIGEYYVGRDGACVYGGWQYDGNGWWYIGREGTVARDIMEEVEGYTYYFDENGYITYGWLLYEGLYSYYDEEGHQLRGWQNIDGSWYFFADDGAMVTGWMNDPKTDTVYYMDQQGQMVTGWQNIAGSDYYFYEDGSRASSCWIGDCYLSNDGAWDPTMEPGTWGYDEEYGWWYEFSDGTFPSECWIGFDGVYYYFDFYGYVVE